MPFMVSMWVTTLPQSMSMDWLGSPSIAIRPPWFMLSIISGRAVGCPDISMPMSKPSRMPSSRWASLTRIFETSIARSTPSRRASSSRGAETSVIAILRAPGAAVAADAADDVAFAGDPVPHLDVQDVLAGLHDLAVELVACDQRGVDNALRPGVPGLDVQVSTADAGGHDADLDVAGAGLRLGTVDELESCVGAGFVESLHGPS